MPPTPIPPDTFRDLIARLDAIERGPDPEDRTEAPRLDHWHPFRDRIGLVRLAGRVEDHPILGNRWIVTSPLLRLSRPTDHARTLSRWYRLGARQDTIPEPLAPLFPAHGTPLSIAQAEGFADALRHILRRRAEDRRKH